MSLRSKDSQISGQHCQITRREIRDGDKTKEQFLIEDLSYNGTYIKLPGARCVKRLARNEPTEFVDGTEVVIVRKNGSHAAISFLFETVQRQSWGQKRHRKFEDFYDKGANIGRGAFADVFRAKHQITGDAFAVKVVHKKRFELVGTVRQVDTMMDEVNILKAVNHENIIKIADVFETKANMMIVLELVEEGELFDHIVKHPFTEAKARDVFRQLLEAIQYLHSRGIAHRDLKPENILVSKVHPDDRLTVKISDFGMARLLGEGSMMKTLAGTPQYLAPEILTNSGVKGCGYKARVDMWSLGVILYILLSSRAPFKGNTGDGKLFHNIQRARYTFGKSFNHISEDAKDLIRHLLVVNPEDRYSATAALKHPWMQVREDAQPPTPRDTRSPASTPHKRKASVLEGGDVDNQSTIVMPKKGRPDPPTLDDLL